MIGLRQLPAGLVALVLLAGLGGGCGPSSLSTPDEGRDAAVLSLPDEGRDAAVPSGATDGSSSSSSGGEQVVEGPGGNGTVPSGPVVAEDTFDARIVAPDQPLPTLPNSDEVIAPPGAPCPGSPPTPGSSCEGALNCTYGDSLEADCRVRAFCEDGAWDVLGATCDETRCPDAPANGGECGTLDNVEFGCGYANGIYCRCPGCTAGPCAELPRFECAAPVEQPACPDKMPNFGAPCTEQALVCAYGDQCASWGQASLCFDGTWRPGPLQCRE